MTTPATLPTGRIYQPISELVDEFREITEFKHQNPDLVTLRTGIKALDRSLGGVWAPGALAVIAGETGGGKSALAGQLALAFGSHADVLVYTLENTAHNSIARAVANIGRLQLGAVRQGWAGEVGLPADYFAATEQLRNLSISYVDRVSPTVEEICEHSGLWVRDMKAKKDGRLPVIIVDQLSHIAPSNAALWDRWERAGHTSRIPRPPRPTAGEPAVLGWQTRVLKLMAEHLGAIVILLAQLNEAHGDQKPGLGSMRGSREINHAADVILMPWRPYVAEPVAPPTVSAADGYTGVDPFGAFGDEVPAVGGPAPVAAPSAEKGAKLRTKSGPAYIIVPKARDGVEFEVEVWWEGAEQRFIDIDADRRAKHTPIPAPAAKAVAASQRYHELMGKFEKARLVRMDAARAEMSALQVPALSLSTDPDEPAAIDGPTAPVAGPAQVAGQVGQADGPQGGTAVVEGLVVYPGEDAPLATMAQLEAEAYNITSL